MRNYLEYQHVDSDLGSVCQALRTFAGRSYFTTKWVRLPPHGLCSSSLWVPITWVPIKNVELRVGYWMRSGEVERSQEEGGGAIKPNMPKLPLVPTKLVLTLIPLSVSRFSGWTCALGSFRFLIGT